MHPLSSGEFILGVDKLIYDEYVLEKTWNTLKNLNKLALPQEFTGV